jgi:hypothetical protein
MNFVAARSNIRAAVKAGLLQITTAKGYRNTILDVFDPPRDVGDMKNFPAMRLLWGPEERENRSEYGGQIAGNRALMPLKWTCDIDVFVVSQADPQGAADSIIADVAEYFGSNYYVPDEQGNRTAFIAVYGGATTVDGTELERPNAWFTIHLDIWYRVLFTDFSTLA